MGCMMVALTSAGKIGMHEAGCISVAYVCGLSLWRICCACLRNVSQGFVSARIVIEWKKTDLCLRTKM